MTVRRRTRSRLVAALATVAFALATPALTSAYADEAPGVDAAQSAADEKAKQLAAAKARAESDKQRLASTQRAVADAQLRLTSLAEEAQAAIARYTKAMHALKRATVVAEAARAALVSAALQVDRLQGQVDEVVRSAYMAGGPINAVAAVMSPGGPATVLHKTTLLNELSRSQARLLVELDRARAHQADVSAQADAAMAAVEKTTQKADAARRDAMSAVSSQHALITDLTTQQIDAAKQLASHEHDVAKLTKERKAAEKAAHLAAERAALAAAWASMQGIGDAMPWATAAQGRAVVRAAKEWLGTPYSWGGGDGDGPTLGFTDEDGDPYALHTVGFDCSGLALYAWAQVGFKIDHYTGYQWVEGHHVPLDKLRAGDLVFFATDVSDPLTIHHVGIFVRGNRMIDAPHKGAVVRYDKVFVPGLIGAVRP